MREPAPGVEVAGRSMTLIGGNLRDRVPGWASLVARWTLGLLLLAMALRGVDIRSLEVALARLEASWLAVALVTVATGIGIKACRWALIVRPVCPECSGSDIVGALLLGQSANILLPFRGGDLARGASIVRVEDGRYGAVLASIALEKALDLIALALAAAISLPLIAQETIADNWPALLGLGLMVLGLIVTGGAVSYRAWPVFRQHVHRLPGGMAERVSEWGDRLVEGLANLRRGRRLVAAILLTSLSWCMMFSTNMALLASLGLKAPAAAGLLVLVVVHLGVAPALMPGNVGPFYFFARIGLAPFGFAAAETTGFAVLLHAVVTLPPLTGACLYLLCQRAWSAKRKR